MELRLGLSLPSNPIKDLDLNKYENDATDDATLLTYNHSCCLGKNKAQKRSFDDALTMVSHMAQTLPLLSWNGKPNDEDDGGGDRNSPQRTSPSTIHESNGEGDGIVGWPPIKRSWRNLHLLHHHHHHHNHQHQQQQQRQRNQAGQIQNDGRNEVGSHGRPISMYVKVKMEGVPIGRKVDLSLHNSYQTLTNTLISMFRNYEGDMKRSSNESTTRYTLAYQDRDGDWQLVGDTPWRTFVSSVQRLEIMVRSRWVIDSRAVLKFPSVIPKCLYDA